MPLAVNLAVYSTASLDFKRLVFTVPLSNLLTTYIFSIACLYFAWNRLFYYSFCNAACFSR